MGKLGKWVHVSHGLFSFVVNIQQFSRYLAPVSPIGPPKAIAANKAQNANPYGPEAHYRPPPSAQDLWDLDLNPDF